MLKASQHMTKRLIWHAEQQAKDVCNMHFDGTEHPDQTHAPRVEPFGIYIFRMLELNWVMRARACVSAVWVCERHLAEHDFMNKGICARTWSTCWRIANSTMSSLSWKWVRVCQAPRATDLAVCRFTRLLCETEFPLRCAKATKAVVSQFRHCIVQSTSIIT